MKERRGKLTALVTQAGKQSTRTAPPRYQLDVGRGNSSLDYHAAGFSTLQQVVPCMQEAVQQSTDMAFSKGTF